MKNAECRMKTRQSIRQCLSCRTQSIFFFAFRFPRSGLRHSREKAVFRRLSETPRPTISEEIAPGRANRPR
jgi:hypothetical protein